MNHDKENKEIFEWANPDGCWHTFYYPDDDRCEKCGEVYDLCYHPDYFTDLNAIHEVEKKSVAKDIGKDYADILGEFIPDYVIPFNITNALITATAEQRANACLRVIREVG